MSQKTENVDAGTVGAQPTGATKKESCSPSGVADQTDALESERAERAALTSRLLASRHVCDELKADLAALQSRLEAALADQRRLDFLETHGLGVDYFPHMTWDCWHGGVRYVGESPRAAIDAAIAQEQKRD